MNRSGDLQRIDEALDAAVTAVSRFTPGHISVAVKDGGDPVTAADLEVDSVLREMLPRPGEGWLSEETADDTARLGCDRVWIVDPIDGPREFVRGIPEWSVSVGLVERDIPVAGGICNPATGERIVGSIETGVRYCGHRRPTGATSLDEAVVLASRTEVDSGAWARFSTESFTVVPVGSVAFKLGLVAAGVADATWTLVPKSEWDVAAGVALVAASGGWVSLPNGLSPTWNGRSVRLSELVASSATLAAEVARLLSVDRPP